MRRVVVTVGTLALVAAGGVALAQATGDERIYSCVSNGDGAIRQVAGPDVACARGWHTLSWSAEQRAIPVTTTYVRRDEAVMEDNIIGVARTVHCNDGDVSTGGGHTTADDDLLVQSRPDPVPGSTAGSTEPTGWQVGARKVAGSPIRTTRFTLYVVCQHTE